MVFKFLIFRRNNHPPAVEPPKNVVSASESALSSVKVYGSTVSGEVKKGRILNGDCYLQALDKMQQQLKSATISKDQSKANNTTKIAIAKLEDRFRVTLVSHTNSPGIKPSKSFTWSSSRTDSSLSYGDFDCIELNPKKKDDLHNIAERMNSAGCLDKCVDVYKSVRKTSLQESYRKLGMRNVSINDIRSLDWEALEANIRHWILVANICVRKLFASEKTLCEHIFGGLGTAIDDDCFLEVVKDPVIQLLNSGKAISICTSSPLWRPEKLFKILDLHEAVSKLFDDFNIIFQSKSFESIRIQAAEMLVQLILAPIDILPQFVTTVLHAQSRFLDYNGSINILTRYVMSYITKVTCYEEKLNNLIVSRPSKLKAIRNSSAVTIPDLDFPKLDERTPLAVHLIWIIEVLQFKLEEKSNCLVDDSLAQLFLMNNVHYIVQTIEEWSKLREIVGDDYLEKLTKSVQRAVTGYQRSTWDRIFHCFRVEGLSSKVSKSALKERLKIFNAMFEEVHQTQATWVVPDVYLREELRFSISEYLIPAYRSFVELFKRHISSGGQQKEYIKYSVKDLDAAISNFFEGSIVH
ncbi:exocyst complex component EXO70A1-like [Cornus florida]|uniref:exocyst complex component EXO70A1-like n=1 Tax=Cornus florida TaxID=4283 RepID=UPI00289EDA13|nr:exocyst complex component EXO70A1-like [Cornus florida]